MMLRRWRSLTTDASRGLTVVVLMYSLTLLDDSVIDEFHQSEINWPSAILKEAHRAKALTERIASDKVCRLFRAYQTNPLFRQKSSAPDGEFGPHPSLPTGPPYGYSSGNIWANPAGICVAERFWLLSACSPSSPLPDAPGGSAQPSAGTGW